MSSVVVLTKQGVRNLNALGPKKKPEGAKPVKEGGPVGAPSETEALVAERPKTDESLTA